MEPWDPSQVLQGVSPSLWLRADQGIYTGGSRDFEASSSAQATRASFAAVNLSTTDFSIFAAINRESTGNQVIAAKYQDANNYWRFEITAGHKLHFIAVVATVTLIEVTGTTNVSTTGQWYTAAVAVDRDGTGTTKVYLNGVDDTSGTPTVSATSIDNTGAFFLGESGAGSLYFDGLMSRIGVFKNDLLTQAEVTWLDNYRDARAYGELGVVGTDGASLAPTWWANCNETATAGDVIDQASTNDLTTAVGLPAGGDPSGMIVRDTGSVGTNHGTLVNFASPETSFSTDTADGSPNPTVEDQSGNSYNGLMTGFAAPDTARSAHGLTGVPGQAITCTGLNGVARPALLASGSFTYSAWVNATSLAASGSNNIIMSQGTNSGGTYIALQYRNVGGLNRFAAYVDAGTDIATSNNAPSTGTWYHLAVSYNSSGNATILYVNGVAQTDTASAAANYTRESQTIGMSPFGGGSAGWVGLIADPRIYSSVLTAPQIAAIAAGDSGATGSPVLRYDFNEDDTRTLSAIGSGYSLSFDGADDYVLLSSAISTGTTFTIAMWVKSAALTAGGYRMLFGLNSSAGLFLYDSPIKLNYYNGGDKVSTGTITANTWTHIALSVSGGNGTFYIDGVNAGTCTGITSINVSNITDVTDTLTGNLDGVRFYAATALSATQVLQLSQGTEATGATPTAHWTFDDGPPTALVDGDPVCSWESLEGSRYQFLQAIADQRFLYRASAIGGQPGLESDSVNDIMTCVNGAVLTGTAFTTIAIWKQKTVPNSYQTLVATSDTAGATKYFALHARGNTANPHIGYEQRNADTADLLDGDTEVTDELDCAGYWSSSGTAISARLNGTAQTLAADGGGNNGDGPGNADTADKDNTTIGGLKHTSETNFAGLILCELIHYPIELTAASRAIVAAYVLARYGLTL